MYLDISLDKNHTRIRKMGDFSCFNTLNTMSTIHCPICEKSFDSNQSAAPPFCSERCRLIDLGRWLDERYGLEYESPEKTDELNPEEI